MKKREKREKREKKGDNKRKGGGWARGERAQIVGRMMGLFGENVLTVDGTVWRGHRKITAPGIGKS